MNCCSSIRDVEGVVALLRCESNHEVCSGAISVLLGAVDGHWHIVADALPDIEALVVDETFQQRERAALLASKLLYYLEQQDPAITYAMQAGDSFDVTDKSDFTAAVLGIGIDRYCKARQEKFQAIAEEHQDEGERMAAIRTFAYSNFGGTRLERLVERMVISAVALQAPENDKEALGVCIEARRFDLLLQILKNSPFSTSLLRYLLRCSETGSRSALVEKLIVQLVMQIYETYLPKRVAGEWTFPTYTEKQLAVYARPSEFVIHEALHVAQSFAITRNAARLADLLEFLLECGDVEAETVALQAAFDVVCFEDQALNSLIIERLIARQKNEMPDKVEEQSAELKNTDNDEQQDEVVIRDESEGSNQATTMTCWDKLRKILSGEMGLELTTKFLHARNQADLATLERIKCSLDSRTSINTTAVAICQGLLLAGTTSDAFIRHSIEWLSRASCWSKFVVAASVGALHRGHFSAAMKVLGSYLPQPRGAGSTAVTTTAVAGGGGPYSEGGAMFALGIVLSNSFRRSEVDYLKTQLETAESATNFEPLKVGACLGLGLMAMGTGDAEISRLLRHVLFADSAVSGEAAGLALGIVHLGRHNQDLLVELLASAKETEHERVQRAAALGAALLCYKLEDRADPIIDAMLEDKADMIRYAGQFAIGMAYCATGQSRAVKRLLEKGVGDLSSDVRRAAVISLGFVLCKKFPELARVVSLLSDSFDPYVRYGAAIAMGIGGSGTADPAIATTLLKLADDSVDFVRQAAYISLGLILCQAHPSSLPEGPLREVRDLFLSTITRKHEDPLARFGAILGAGIIDCAGRNGTFALFSHNGSLRPESAVGFFLFSQLWYWHPYSLGLVLALQPLGLIGVATDLSVPSDYVVACRTSVAERCAYLEPRAPTTKDPKANRVTAVLSVSKKKKKEDNAAGSSTTTTGGTTTTTTTAAPAAAAATTAAPPPPPPPPPVGETAATSPPNKTKGSDSDYVLLPNPIRVLPPMRGSLRLNLPHVPWEPLISDRRLGFVMLKKKVTSDPQPGSFRYMG